MFMTDNFESTPHKNTVGFLDFQHAITYWVAAKSPLTFTSLRDYFIENFNCKKLEKKV